MKIGPLSDEHTRRAHQRKIRTSVGRGARTFGGISFPPRLVTILLTCVCVCVRFFLVQNSSRRLTMRAFDRASLSPGSTVCDAIVGRESTAKKQKKSVSSPPHNLCMYACLRLRRYRQTRLPHPLPLLVFFLLSFARIILRARQPCRGRTIFFNFVPSIPCPGRDGVLLHSSLLARRRKTPLPHHLYAPRRSRNVISEFSCIKPSLRSRREKMPTN